MSVPLEHDYIGLSDTCSSIESETTTELCLGLPGFGQFKSGAKRGFSDVNLNGYGKWVLGHGSEPQLGGNQTQKPASDTHVKLVEQKNKGILSENVNSAPSAKAQVVGWPPIRSFRKNTMASNLTKSGDIGNSPSKGCLYVKVSMDGAPYLRKIDLKIYHNYTELSKALEKMFSCFTLGKYTSNGIRGQEGLSESNLKDLLHGSECVLTYEDKDGDWMLVGDVPWEMFIDSCKRLRIMKGSEAIGLAPRSTEKMQEQKLAQDPSLTSKEARDGNTYKWFFDCVLHLRHEFIYVLRYF